VDESTEDTCRLRYENELISEEERVLFDRMIWTMLVLEPEKSASIDDVVKSASEWFVKYLEFGRLIYLRVSLARTFLTFCSISTGPWYTTI
jgi:hypothetical protein